MLEDKAVFWISKFFLLSFEEIATLSLKSNGLCLPFSKVIEAAKERFPDQIGLKIARRQPTVGHLVDIYQDLVVLKFFDTCSTS